MSGFSGLISLCENGFLGLAEQSLVRRQFQGVRPLALSPRPRSTIDPSPARRCRRSNAGDGADDFRSRWRQLNDRPARSCPGGRRVQRECGVLRRRPRRQSHQINRIVHLVRAAKVLGQQIFAGIAPAFVALFRVQPAGAETGERGHSGEHPRRAAGGIPPASRAGLAVAVHHKKIADMDGLDRHAFDSPRVGGSSPPGSSPPAVTARRRRGHKGRAESSVAPV